MALPAERAWRCSSKSTAWWRTSASPSSNSATTGAIGTPCSQCDSAPSALRLTSVTGSLSSPAIGPMARGSSRSASASTAAERTSPSESASTAIRGGTARRSPSWPSECAAARRTPAFSSLSRAIRALTTVVSSPPGPLSVLVLTPWPPLPSGEGERTSSPLSGTERGAGGEDETRGAAATVAATPRAASTAQPRREAGLWGRRLSSRRAIRATRSDRRSARPATGTPSGDA